MSGHTPGPLFVHEELGQIFIVKPPHAYLGQAFGMENACLWSAAPDLLASLVAAMAFIESHVADPDITEKMCETFAALQACNPHAAIAKARGQ